MDVVADPTKGVTEQREESFVCGGDRRRGLNLDEVLQEVEHFWQMLAEIVQNLMRWKLAHRVGAPRDLSWRG